MRSARTAAPQQALQLAAPVPMVVLHEIGPAIPAYVAVPVMFLRCLLA